MLFPTPEYALFFILAFAGAWLSARRLPLHKSFLLVASYAFYAYGDVRFVPVLLCVSVFSTGIAAWVQRNAQHRYRKLALSFGVAGLLAILVAFKFITFLTRLMLDGLQLLGVESDAHLPEVMLPIGISFFVFHGISLLVDAFRGHIATPISWLDGLLYIAFFPQLVAGPILRARNFLPQLVKGPSRDLDMSYALGLFMSGLVKKVLFANFLATQIVDPVYADWDSASQSAAVLAFYGYAAQIFCDFSGYTDMAIASALLLGYSLPKNFDAPYLATDLRDFWRRWHISLSSWLRDYLYIPLGGSRHGSVRTSINLVVTMVLGGLWHGAAGTFVAWGAWHGVGLLVHRAWDQSRFRPIVALRATPIWRILAGVLTFHFVCIGWVMFRAPNLDALRGVFRAMAEGTSGTFPIAAATIVLAGWGIQIWPKEWNPFIYFQRGRYAPLLQGALFAAGLWFISILAPSGVLPFIYFQF